MSCCRPRSHGRLDSRRTAAVFENAGHFAYLDQFDRFRLLVGRFLRDQDRRREGTSL